MCVGNTVDRPITLKGLTEIFCARARVCFLSTISFDKSKCDGTRGVYVFLYDLRGESLKNCYISRRVPACHGDKNRNFDVFLEEKKHILGERTNTYWYGRLITRVVWKRSENHTVMHSHCRWIHVILSNYSKISDDRQLWIRYFSHRLLKFCIQSFRLMSSRSIYFNCTVQKSNFNL